MNALTKFQAIGLDSALANRPGADFLINSRLIYSIAGYQNNTLGGKESHAIKVDEKGALMIKKEGVWTAVSEIGNQFLSKSTQSGIPTIAEPARYWNYLSPEGLVPVDRFRGETLASVEKLSAEEMGQLLEHAKTFTSKRTVSTAGPLNCVIQIVTNPRKWTSRDDHPLLTNWSAQLRAHAGIRLISSEGAVYSTGFGADETQEKWIAPINGLASTINGVPTVLDYEEFRKHEGRIVTSIAITASDFDNVLNLLNGYRKETLRFNLLTQNCTSLAKQCLKTVGMECNNEMTLGDLFLNTLPPRFQRLRHVIQGKITKTPWLRTIFKVLLFIPKMLLTLILHGLLWSLGAAKGSPLPETDPDAEIDAQDKNESVRQFRAILTSPKDMFSEEVEHIHHSFPLIQWQLQQQSTAVHRYQNKPEMGILPKDDPELHKYFTKKYIDNFR